MRKASRRVCQLLFMGFQQAGTASTLPLLTETMPLRPEMSFRNGNRDSWKHRHRPTELPHQKNNPLPQHRQFQRSRQLPGIPRQEHPPRRCSFRASRIRSKAPMNIPSSRDGRQQEISRFRNRRSFPRTATTRLRHLLRILRSLVQKRAESVSQKSP